MSHKIDICKYLNICRHIIVHSPSTFPQVFSATHLCVIASRDTAGLLGVKLAPVPGPVGLAGVGLSLGLARGELSLMRSGL